MWSAKSLCCKLVRPQKNEREREREKITNYPGEGGGTPRKIRLGQALNGVQEGKGRMGEGGRVEQVASSEKKD